MGKELNKLMKPRSAALSAWRREMTSLLLWIQQQHGLCTHFCCKFKVILGYYFYYLIAVNVELVDFSAHFPVSNFSALQFSLALF